MALSGLVLYPFPKKFHSRFIKGGKRKKKNHVAKDNNAEAKKKSQVAQAAKMAALKLIKMERRSKIPHRPPSLIKRNKIQKKGKRQRRSAEEFPYERFEENTYRRSVDIPNRGSVDVPYRRIEIPHRGSVEVPLMEFMYDIT